MGQNIFLFQREKTKITAGYYEIELIFRIMKAISQILSFCVTYFTTLASLFLNKIIY